MTKIENACDMAPSNRHSSTFLFTLRQVRIMATPFDLQVLHRFRLTGFASEKKEASFKKINEKRKHIFILLVDSYNEWKHLVFIWFEVSKLSWSSTPEHFSLFFFNKISQKKKTKKLYEYSVYFIFCFRLFFSVRCFCNCLKCSEPSGIEITLNICKYLSALQAYR